MHEIVLVGSAARTLRKLDRFVQSKIVAEIECIAKTPYAGEQLHGHLSTVYSWHTRVQGIDYRIAYRIKEAEVTVLVLKLGPRENFYKELWKILQ